MKRNAFVLWSLVLLVVALAGVWSVRAQEGHTVYLPVISYTSSDLPVIHYFRTPVEIADPGDTIEMEWASSGGQSAQLWRIERGGPIAEFWDVALSGTFTYTIPTHKREFITFQLAVTGAQGHTAYAGLTIPLTCPDSWFFEPAPEGCPGDAALFSLGAEQPFEHGTMVWVEGQDGIYVLFGDEVHSPRWSFYEDTWEEGDPLCDTRPVPPGLFQPERGFGKLWCEQPDLFKRLGWATAHEVGYDGAIQRDSAPKYTTLYMRAADGNVYKLLPERSGWERIIVTGP